MDEPISRFSVDSLSVSVFETRAALGRAAARDVAREISEFQARSGEARVVFAAAPSQDEFLAELVQDGRVDWSRIVALHMDEYLGLPPDHPASFRNYLQRNLFDPAGIEQRRLRPIAADRPEKAASVAFAYEMTVRGARPDLVCAGIGENGHLAFNDPPVADFADPLWVKAVKLDQACRLQQVHDGCFGRIEDVPTHALTLTIPALLSAPVVSVVVPGPRKAEAIERTLRGPMNEQCPASALRTHPGARLYLDRESASRVL